MSGFLFKQLYTKRIVRPIGPPLISSTCARAFWSGVFFIIITNAMVSAICLLYMIVLCVVLCYHCWSLCYILFWAYHALWCSRKYSSNCFPGVVCWLIYLHTMIIVCRDMTIACLRVEVWHRLGHARQWGSMCSYVDNGTSIWNSDASLPKLHQV